MREFNCEFDRVEVNGPLATAVGHGNWTVEIDGTQVPATFKFADVFRKSSDGRWLYAHVIWNMDAPSAES
jgi:ketosteroid isomerase-like protein